MKYTNENNSGVAVAAVISISLLFQCLVFAAISITWKCLVQMLPQMKSRNGIFVHVRVVYSNGQCTFIDRLHYVIGILCVQLFRVKSNTLWFFGARMSHKYTWEMGADGLPCFALPTAIQIEIESESENAVCTCPGHCTDAPHFPRDLWLLFNILHLNY